MIWADEYTVRLLDDLPPAVPGFVSESPDGHYNVYINARLSLARQRAALDHELRHIERGDLDSGRSIHEIEDDVLSLPTHNALGIPGVIMAADLLDERPIPAEPAPAWPPPPETLTREQYTLIYGTPEQIRQYCYNRFSTIENGMVIGL